MVAVQLPKRIFGSYHVSDNEEICINTAMLSSVLEDPTDELLDISITRDPVKSAMPPDSSAWFIGHMMFSTSDYEYRLKLPRAETIRKSPKLFQLIYTTICHTPFAPVQKAIKKAARMNDYIRFSSFTDELGRNVLAISTEVDDTEKLRTFFRDDSDSTSIHILKPSKAMFSLDYLNDVMMSCRSDNIRLKFSTDSPICIEFDILNWGKATFMQAPRIECE